VCFDPAATPFAHHPITGSQGLGNLAIRPGGLLMRQQHNLGAQHLGVWGRMGANALSQVHDGFVR
jgi:hypothetical protein